MRRHRHEDIAPLADLQAESRRFVQVLAGSGHEPCIDAACLNAAAVLYVAGKVPDARHAAGVGRRAGGRPDGRRREPAGSRAGRRGAGRMIGPACRTARPRRRDDDRKNWEMT
jgi:hypothetical protein